jgi:hypothetical protein
MRYEFHPDALFELEQAAHVRELGFGKSADVFPVSESIRTPLPATLN